MTLEWGTTRRRRSPEKTLLLRTKIKRCTTFLNNPSFSFQLILLNKKFNVPTDKLHRRTNYLDLSLNHRGAKLKKCSIFTGKTKNIIQTNSRTIEDKKNVCRSNIFRKRIKNKLPKWCTFLEQKQKVFSYSFTFFLN